MDIQFSMDWIFAVLTLGSLLFIVQILYEYSRQAGNIKPKIRAVDQIQERHSQEMEKVEKLTKNAQAEGSKLDARIAELEHIQDELDETRKALEKAAEEET